MDNPSIKLELGCPKPDQGANLKIKLSEWLKTDISRIFICPWYVNGECCVNFSINDVSEESKDKRSSKELYLEMKKLLDNKNSELYKYTDECLGKYQRLQHEFMTVYLVFKK